MSRWRVRYSARTATWFYADRVAFVDADSNREAVAAVEASAEPETTHQAWACTPATAEMEQRHAARLAAYAEWHRRLKASESVRGLV